MNLLYVYTTIYIYLRGLMMPLTSWRMGNARFLLRSMRSAVAASSSVLVMELRTVGMPLLPTRTSASTFRCSKRTSIVGMSIPTLQQQLDHRQSIYDNNYIDLSRTEN